MSRTTIRSAVLGVAPAIEVVDYSSAAFDLRAMAAGSSFHAGFVVGELRCLDDVPALAAECPRFRRGDEVLGVPDPSLVPADLTTLISYERLPAPFTKTTALPLASVMTVG